jgi:uncharacterized membrane protein
MLVVFPLGLLSMAVVFDLLALGFGQGYWSEVAYWMMAAGVVTGLLAAPFGSIDWFAIPAGTRAKRIGALHGIGNVVVVVLFGVSWWMRGAAPAAPSTVALLLSFLGGAIAMATGWLGGELVDRLGVGVDDGAHVNAPSSLSNRRV